MLSNLSDYDIILASNSPRRQELMQQSRIPFRSEVCPDLCEDFSKELSAHQVPQWLALNKMAAYEHIWKQPNKLVVTADTVVLIDNEIINKPADKEEAVEMLKLLSGKMHEVITGVAIKSAHKEVAFKDITKVWFRDLRAEDINHYVDNYHPFDKAGSYGIQEWIGLIGIRKIDGSYFNVMGLPVDLLFEELRKF